MPRRTAKPSTRPGRSPTAIFLDELLELSERSEGMIECMAVPGDNLLANKTCPHCRQAFEAGEKLFQSADLEWVIHSACLVSLAQPAIDEQARHEETRQRILKNRSLLNDE